ncbi:hypothetical protein DASC09_027000 [Saccharomycopsis crataegensis]|uniref:Uncharacterized protein n=1 Tax=Saccharomycopsis crataegensis TaxID=43959 RepID=A0AAV5QM02_9ASCO|nr:hypothetical protein DASC09_027000 [Saccharomycopsis crataegensis]
MEKYSAMADNLKSVFERDYMKLFKMVDKKLDNFCERIMGEFCDNTVELNEVLNIGSASKDLLTIFGERATEMELAFVAAGGDVQDEFWEILEKIGV